MRISDRSSDVCSSDLGNRDHRERRWVCCRSSLLAFLPRLDGRHHRLGDIDLDVQTQFLQYREQLAPLDGFATPLDLAQEVLAHTDAFRGSVLPQTLVLAHGLDQRPQLGGSVQSDRKSVGSGTRVAVRVNLGGCSNIKKKKKQ